MRYRRHDRISPGQILPRQQANAIFAPRLAGIGLGVVNEHLDSVGFQFVEDVHHLRVAQIGTVFQRERQTPMSASNTMKFKLDPKNPPPLTSEQRKRLKAIAAMPDVKIDYSDMPRQTVLLSAS